MFLDYTPEQWDLKKTLRAYFQALIGPELLAEVAEVESGGPLYHAALQQMGRDGWLGIAWPKEYGGQARGPVDQFIFFDEVQRAGFPIPILTLSTVGPTLMRHGSEAQKAEFLPRILKGTVHFSIGYTEGSAGTDLASLKTKAVLDGDDFVVSGQKLYCSLASHADYLWLAVRTDPDAPKHKGISILMVDREAPGVSMTPIRALGDNHIFAVYLDQVRVPRSRLVGQLNGGWQLITAQLNHERVALFPVGFLERFLEEITAWAATERTSGGERLLDKPWVQANLAKVHAGLEVLRVMNWRQAWAMSQGDLPAQDASMIKIYGSEFYVEANRLLMEVLGDVATLQRDSPAVVLQGRLERYYRGTLVLTFGGGANEIQRDIISMVGLRMPRPPR